MLWSQKCALLSISVDFSFPEGYKRKMKTETRSQQKVSVLLPDEDAFRFESYCEEFGHKKSTLIARLVRDFLNRENYPAQQSLRVEHAKEH